MIAAHFGQVILSPALHMELDAAASSSNVVLSQMGLEVGAAVVRGGQSMVAIE